MVSCKRIWFITGGSSGLGRALARRVLTLGQRAVVTARNPADLAELACAFPETCRPLTLDVTDTDGVKSAAAAAVECFGGLDVVVNNAPPPARR